MARRKIEAKELPKESPYRTAKGYRYVVRWPVEIDGRTKYRTKFFAHGESEEAKAFAEAKQIQRTNHGTASQAVLDERTLEMAARCVKRLRKREKTLEQATDHFLAWLDDEARRSAEKTVTVSQAADHFIDSKEKAKKPRSPKYMKDLKQKLAVFERDFGERVIGEVPTEDLEEWLNGLPFGAVTVAGYFRIVRGLFRFAVKRKWLTISPTDDVDTGAFDEDEEQPEILTVQEAAKLLENCSDTVLPAVVLGLFCGIRTSEVQRVTWANVKLNRNLVHLPAKITKIGEPRYVTIPDNALAWLNSVPSQRGRIRPAEGQENYWVFEKEFREARTNAKITAKWKNQLRHSFGAYHYANHRDIGKTAAELGHKGTSITWKHYNKLVDPEDAEIFWGIVPANVTEIGKKKGRRNPQTA